MVKGALSAKSAVSVFSAILTGSGRTPNKLGYYEPEALLNGAFLRGALISYACRREF